MDRTALVGGHGKGGLLDHGPEDLLLDGKAVLVLHLGKLRVVRGGQTQDVEVGVAALEVDRQLGVGGKDDDVVGHPADDVAKEPGVEDDFPRLCDFRADFSPDAGLHVVAGDGQTGGCGLEQEAFQGGNGALGGHRTGCGAKYGLEQGLFAGKFHGVPSFLMRELRDALPRSGKKRQAYFRKEKHKLIF